jgi:uncharacterized heparinase superfamily protein
MVVSSFARLQCLWHTLRPIPPSRLLWRVWRRLQRPYFTSRWYAPWPDTLATPAAVHFGPRLIPGSAATGTALAAGQFHLVGEHQAFTIPFRTWLPAGTSLLFQFTLHYHEWLTDLRAASQRASAQILLSDWLQHYGTYHPVVWHPYPLSLRIVSWLTHADWVLPHAPATLAAQFSRVLHAQVAHLQRECEWDLHGNHLLKNLKALVYAAVCLPAFARTLSQALNRFTTALLAQVHADGGHDEASPAYHAQVLQDVLEVIALLQAANHPVPSALTTTAGAMGAAMQVLRHPDGGLALFNDGSVGHPATLDALTRLSHPTAPNPLSLPITGYARLAAGSAVLIMDAGPEGPAANPGHAHADGLSFELSDGPERLIVNCGTHAYQTPLRSFFRSTAAHSTVSLGTHNSTQVWGTFRVGRRYGTISFQQPSPLQVSGWHGGYAHLGVTQHRRNLTLGAGGHLLAGEDTLTHSSPPPLTATAHFHLTPPTTVQLLSPTQCLLTLASGAAWVFTAGAGTLSVASSRYAPQFGPPQPSQQLHLSLPLATHQPHTTLRWQLHKKTA